MSHILYTENYHLLVHAVMKLPQTMPITIYLIMISLTIYPTPSFEHLCIQENHTGAIRALKRNRTGAFCATSQNCTGVKPFRTGAISECTGGVQKF